MCENHQGVQPNMNPPWELTAKSDS